MSKTDIYESVTNGIIAGLEQGIAGDVTLPWLGDISMPENIASQNPYKGVNVALLWAQSYRSGYQSPIWGTYKQWVEKGASVKKGEKATKIVFWKSIEVEPQGDNAEAETRMYARWSNLFNLEQVEGYTPKSKAAPDDLQKIAQIDNLIEAMGIEVRHGGHKAFYNRKDDYIQLPCPSDFKDTKTASALEHYQATLLHEIIHLSGSPHRLDRKKGQKFGDEDYAFEELVAEIGAAMLCSLYGISTSLRDDHIPYINNWLEELKQDKKFIFKASSQAQKAASYILSF